MTTHEPDNRATEEEPPPVSPAVAELLDLKVRILTVARSAGEHDLAGVLEDVFLLDASGLLDDEALDTMALLAERVRSALDQVAQSDPVTRTPR